MAIPKSRFSVQRFTGSPSAGKTGGLSGLPQPQGPTPRRGISSSTGSFSLAIDDGPFEEFFDDIPLSRSARKAKLLLLLPHLSVWAVWSNPVVMTSYDTLDPHYEQM